MVATREKPTIHIGTKNETSVPLCGCGIIHEEGVERALDTAPEAGTVLGLAELFKVFADPTRLRILSALSSGELCVCDLVAVLGASQSAVSHQLALLRSTRLVKYRREGKVVFYSLDDEHVGEILRVGLEHVQEGRETP